MNATLNEFDGSFGLPLDLAFHTHQKSIAIMLVKHHADVNMPDQTGCCLLHKAIKTGQS